MREILDAARANVARTVDTSQVMANWLIGREIVQEEQRGKRRADYGQQLVALLSVQLTQTHGRGWSAPSRLMRQFYLAYPGLLGSAFDGGAILYAVSRESATPKILHALRREFAGPAARLPDVWQPGTLHANLAWTHYRTLLRVDRLEARAFYEIEAIRNAWAARELERQINSLLFDRLAKSRDKQGLMRLATRGHEVRQSSSATTADGNSTARRRRSARSRSCTRSSSIVRSCGPALSRQRGARGTSAVDARVVPTHDIMHHGSVRFGNTPARHRNAGLNRSPTHASRMARQLHADHLHSVRRLAMRLVRFNEHNVANELARMSDEELDSLAFGAIELDCDGKIIRYNAAEADISSRDQADMVGRNFFSDVAPCTRGEAFEGRFRAGVMAGGMDVQFTYVLDHKMTPTEVRVRMHQAEGKDTYWVLIKRITAEAIE